VAIILLLNGVSLYAEFWVESTGNNYDEDTNDAGPTSTWTPTRCAFTLSMLRRTTLGAKILSI